MTNNDVLRRLRYTFNYNDKKMVALFDSAGVTVTREQVCAWLKREGDEEAVNCPDNYLAGFLNGFINEKRGKREGPQPVPEKRTTNNIVLTKLKIALNLKAEDIVALLALADINIGKGELSAFFRKPEHKNYRQCKDQFLRNFLLGIEKQYYVERTTKKPESGNENKAAKGVGSSSKPNSYKGGQSKERVEDKFYKQANPNASKVYVNPNKTEKESTRKVLKLKPSDIYKDA